MPKSDNGQRVSAVSGACFKRHLDSPKGEGRLLTAIFYANTGWALEHGSTLRAWTAGSTSRDEILEVLPMADRLVVFLSEDVWHEVTPNVHESYKSVGYRCAFTVWF